MRRILVIDDDPAVQSVIKSYLRSDQITSAHTVSEAVVALANEWPFDLILLDIVLSDGDGLQFLRMLRGGDWLNHFSLKVTPDSNIEKLKKIKKGLEDCPIVMLTGDGSKESVMEASQSGMNDYIVKPVKMDAMVDKINSIVPQTGE